MRFLAINIRHHFDVDVCLVLLVVILHGDCPDNSPQTASARERAMGGSGGGGADEGGRRGGGCQLKDWVENNRPPCPGVCGTAPPSPVCGGGVEFLVESFLARQDRVL